MITRHIAVLGGGLGARTVAANMALAGHKLNLFEFAQSHDNNSKIFERKRISITGKTRKGDAVNRPHELYRWTAQLKEGDKNG